VSHAQLLGCYEIPQQCIRRGESSGHVTPREEVAPAVPVVPATGTLKDESSLLPPQPNEGDEETDTDEEPLRPTAVSASPGVRVERGEELHL
jgi:hypothetical protein